jgi:hypothetical protein
MVSRASLDDLEIKKVSCPYRDATLDSPAGSPVGIPTTLLLLTTLPQEENQTISEILWFIYKERGTQWHSWLRHCATRRKVAGSIPYGVTEIFN